MMTVSQPMVIIYSNLILNDARTIESLPDIYKVLVKQHIESLKK